jgi:hypothetical protein
MSRAGVKPKGTCPAWLIERAERNGATRRELVEEYLSLLYELEDEGNIEFRVYPDGSFALPRLTKTGHLFSAMLLAESVEDFERGDFADEREITGRLARAWGWTEREADKIAVIMGIGWKFGMRHNERDDLRARMAGKKRR